MNNNPYSGVLISDDLKWSTHIYKIFNQANSTPGIEVIKLEFILRLKIKCND